MYKMLIFLRKSDDPNTEKHFRNFTLPILNQLTGKEIKTANVESSLLLDQKYTLFSEVVVESRSEWDKLMSSAAGRQLNKDLMDFHRSIDLIFVNYDEVL